MFLKINKLIITLKFKLKYAYLNNDFFLAGSKHLRLLLSFSVGGMLGDVFLHVLPEVWISSKGMFHNQ